MDQKIISKWQVSGLSLSDFIVQLRNTGHFRSVQEYDNDEGFDELTDEEFLMLGAENERAECEQRTEALPGHSE